jgi:hypothetical protein
MKSVASLLVCVLLGLTSLEARQITFTNKCGYKLWIAPLTNAQGPVLPPGIMGLDNGQTGTYQIPNSGWGGRFWPKSGCDADGEYCEVGQSVAPCDGGCDPPAETKVEFFFPGDDVPGAVWYDVSLVDGYSLPVEIVPDSQVKGDTEGLLSK